MPAKPPNSILFVCLGNICRSPLAEGVFKSVINETGADIVVDSAGTGAWHIGNPPDPRSIAVAAKHGIDIATQRARQLHPSDFERFDLLLGLDRSNVSALRTRAPGDARGRVHLFLEYAGMGPLDVPDPYYGGDDGFETVYRMIREASEGLSAKLGARAASPP
ncbi:MAG: low molecular weight phosphotyrosine protein phosphatase [Rhizobiaceae bacterium]|nr:low molecular weight phosphotyrosine protein phosphatase [Rhizobiaceae bacterium]